MADLVAVRKEFNSLVAMEPEHGKIYADDTWNLADMVEEAKCWARWDLGTMDAKGNLEAGKFKAIIKWFLFSATYAAESEGEECNHSHSSAMMDNPFAL